MLGCLVSAAIFTALHFAVMITVLEFAELTADDLLRQADHLLQSGLADLRDRGEPDCDGSREHTFHGG